MAVIVRKTENVWNQAVHVGHMGYAVIPANNIQTAIQHQSFVTETMMIIQILDFVIQSKFMGKFVMLQMNVQVICFVIMGIVTHAMMPVMVDGPPMDPVSTIYKR